MPSAETKSQKKPLLVILGPTAVGKSEVAIQLAQVLNGEIVSADSRMFYIGMDIGTAKPSPAEQARVPHHLIDVTQPDAPWSLATFQERAHLALDEIHQRGRLPMLVGGTGQYLRAVTQGWQLPTAGPDFRLRQALEGWGADLGPLELHRRLGVIDPAAAGSIDERNMRRTIRALEVIFQTGRPYSAQRRSGTPRYQILQVGLTLPRLQLYHRIDQRVDRMLADGLVAEVRHLLQSGLSPDLEVFSAIGYREIIAYIQDQLELDEAVRGIKRATRVLVRRQANWFKADDPDIHWFDLAQTPISAITALVESWLESSLL